MSPPPVFRQRQHALSECRLHGEIDNRKPSGTRVSTVLIRVKIKPTELGKNRTSLLVSHGLARQPRDLETFATTITQGDCGQKELGSKKATVRWKAS